MQDESLSAASRLLAEDEATPALDEARDHPREAARAGEEVRGRSHVGESLVGAPTHLGGTAILPPNISKKL